MLRSFCGHSCGLALVVVFALWLSVINKNTPSGSPHLQSSDCSMKSEKKDVGNDYLDVLKHQMSFVSINAWQKISVDCGDVLKKWQDDGKFGNGLRIFVFPTFLRPTFDFLSFRATRHLIFLLPPL